VPFTDFLAELVGSGLKGESQESV